MDHLQLIIPAFDIEQTDYNRYRVYFKDTEICRLMFRGNDEYSIDIRGYFYVIPEEDLNTVLIQSAHERYDLGLDLCDLTNVVKKTTTALAVYAKEYPHLYKLCAPKIVYDRYDGISYEEITCKKEVTFTRRIECEDANVGEMIADHMTTIDIIWELLPFPIAEQLSMHILFDENIQTYSSIIWANCLRDYRAGRINYRDDCRISPAAALANYETDLEKIKRRLVWRDSSGDGIIDLFPPVFDYETYELRPNFPCTYDALERHFTDRYRELK